jgi:hypothetical protein
VSDDFDVELPQDVPQAGEKAVADELREIGATLVPDASGAAPEGEGGAPAGVSDEEEPPEPPETKRIREQKERFRAMREEAAAELQQMIDSAPEDSALKLFLRSEAERDARMEPLRVAFIKAQKKGQPGKEE